jgi:hypothetical protein
MPFNPLDVPVAFMSPAYLSNVLGWTEHIPFAFTIAALSKPRTLVELGTHRGDSYLAFCQAIKKLNLPTRCTAVDTWKGDPQAGFYGEEVYTALSAEHDPKYGTFSRLMRSDFDTAVQSFEDASIDLLHIDGLHTYEAVRHDYETWLAKLSPRAVVLFHDTAVKDRGFGVYRLFDEISQKHPSFNFLHGYGLGIVAPGDDPPAAVLDFLDTANAQPDAVRSCFAILGNRVQLIRDMFMLLDVVSVNQNVLNTIRRKLNLAVDANWENPQLIRQNPIQFLIHQNKTVVELMNHLQAIPK